MVNIFGTSSDSAGGRGPAGPPGAGGIKDLILWFPGMICEQVRKKLNATTFLIETIPSARDPELSELSANKTVNGKHSTTVNKF